MKNFFVKLGLFMVLFSCSNSPSAVVTPENTNDVNNATDVNLQANPTIINQIQVPETTLKNASPVIQILTANPTKVTQPHQKISLSVEAFDENGDSISYTWSATAGILSATKGELVNWTAQKLDGTPEDAGTAIIQLFISDNKGGTDKADLNIRISEDGSSQVISGLIMDPS